MNVFYLKIVSGGQTGVDQGALAAALKAKVPCGGWCPSGRRSEDGKIPAIFPVCDLPSSKYADRTLQNVRDTDGTLIIFSGSISGGTELTKEFCDAELKPYLLIDVCKISCAQITQKLINFIHSFSILTLNVSGPRRSEWPNAYNCAFRVITNLFGKMNSF